MEGENREKQDKRIGADSFYDQQRREGIERRMTKELATEGRNREK
jgi:hypothetical protein